VEHCTKLNKNQTEMLTVGSHGRTTVILYDAWLSGWLAKISADLRETVAH